MEIVDMKDDCFVKVSLYAKLNLYESVKSGNLQTMRLLWELSLRHRHTF